MIWGRKKNDYGNRNIESKIKKPEEPVEEEKISERGRLPNVPNPFSSGGHLSNIQSNIKSLLPIVTFRDPMEIDYCYPIGQFWFKKPQDDTDCGKLWILSEVKNGKAIWIWI